MSNSPSQPIRKMPAARGLAWVTGSWAMIKRQPLRLLLISLLFQFLLSFSQANALGLVVILCLPLLSAGLLQAFFLVERGEKPLLAVLFMPFTAGKSVSQLLLLGAIVMALGLLVMSLVLAGQMVDLDPELLKRIEQGDIDALQLVDPAVVENAVIAMAIGAAVSGSITYFSVPLIWFNKQGLGSALIMGLRALGRNWQPLLVIGALLALLAVPIILMFGTFYMSAINDGTASIWLGALVLLIGPVFQLLLFGTQYLAFKDIFGMDDAVDGSVKKAPDQLVA